LENITIRKRYLGLFIASLFVFAAPMVMVQHSDHVEVWAFAESFRFSQTKPASNFIGLGGRIAFNMRPSVQLEAEMAYDFQRSFANEFRNAATTEPQPPSSARSMGW
jgi:hypothetical protein